MTVKTKAGIVTVILMIAAIFVSILALPAQAVIIDIPNSGAANSTKLSASDILLTLFGDEGFTISDEEKAYLDEYSGEGLSYSPKLPSSNVESEYDVQTGSLTVKAKEYAYTSVTGVKAVWTPTNVNFGDMTSPLVYDATIAKYTATVEGIEEGSVSSVTVTYTTDISFSEKTLNGLLTKAYNDAEAWDEYATYLAELNEYSTQLELYRQYLVDKMIYSEKNTEYQAYLKEKAEYDAAKALFDKYEADLAKYNSDYALYVKYVADKQAYDKNIKAYNEYVKNYDLVKAQLAVINGTDKGLPTIGRPLRGAILGDTVTQVVNNKDAIANDLTGVHGSVVDDAGTATEKLRELFEGYFSKKDEADRYIHYSLNYEQWRDAFTQLLQALDYLFQNPKVVLALDTKDMVWKYEILLAQLYYVVVALNDKPVPKLNGGYFDSYYKISKKSPITYVENVAYVKDPGTAAPIVGGYPSKVEKPIEPTPVSEPAKPVAVTRPIPPNEVENPGEEPVEVKHPTLPDAVSAPDKKLVKDGVINSDILALIEAYKNGKIAKRDEIIGGRSLTLFATATKSVLKVDEITVHFYGTNNQLMTSVKVDRGGYVEFSGKTPTKTAKDKIYTFIGWQTEDGTIVDTTAIDPVGNEISLYPAFSEEVKKFTVTWRVEGESFEEEYEYGETPTYSSTPTKDRVGTNNFVFVGWNPEIKPVTSNTTYIAQFKTVPIASDKNGNEADVDLETDPEKYTVDFTENIGRDFELADVIELASEEMKGVDIVFDSGTVVLSFSDVMEMKEYGATVISLTSSSADVSGEGASFRLSLTTPDGRVPDAKMRVTVKITASISSVSNTTLTKIDGDERVDVPAIITEDGIVAEIEVGAVYTTRREFKLSVLPSADVSLSVDKTACAPGDIVRVSYSAPLGVRIVKLYYIGQNGEKITIPGVVFAMPAEDVTIGIEYEYVTYTVRFASDGRVIHTATYKPGEMPSFPGSPTKAADESYTYTFVGWDKEFKAVDGNEVYNAIYEKKEIIREAPKEGLIVTDGVLKIIVLVVVALIYIGAIVLPCVVIVIIKVVRRCMRKLPKKAKKSE